MQSIKILVSDPHQHLHCLFKKNYYSHSGVAWLFIMVLILLIVIRNCLLAIHVSWGNIRFFKTFIIGSFVLSYILYYQIHDL